jgi:transposase
MRADEAGAGYTASELAERLGVHKRTITRTITAQGDAGLVIHNEREESGKHYRAEDSHIDVFGEALDQSEPLR